MSNLSRKAPVLDTWVSLPLRGQPHIRRKDTNVAINIVGTPDDSLSLDGYSFSTLTSSTSLYGATTWQTMRGRNIYVQLLLMIRATFAAGGAPWAAFGLNPQIVVIEGDRGRWGLRLSIGAASSFDVVLPGPDGWVDESSTRAATPRGLGFRCVSGELSRISFIRDPSTGYASATVYEPVGVWQPEHMGWTVETDREISYRSTVSPYDMRTESRLFWGVRDMLDIRYEMVHAGEIFRARNGDIPCEGWASAAHMTPWTGRTLEDILPWLAMARPQGDASSSWAGWMNDGIDGRPAAPWVPAMGTPAILHLTTQTITDWGSALYFPTYAGSGSSSWSLGRSDLVRHLTLQPGASLRSVVEEQLGARRYRVTVPFYDVTPVPRGVGQSGIGDDSRTPLQGNVHDGGDY